MCKTSEDFYVHVTVHRDMWPCIVTCDRASWHVTVHRDMWTCIVTNFFIINQPDSLISQVYFVRKLQVSDGSSVHHQELFTAHSAKVCHTDSFRAAGSGWDGRSILILLRESCLQTSMTYTIAECTVNSSWWWTEELSETCSFIPK
jgi:hypothetical protein